MRGLPEQRREQPRRARQAVSAAFAAQGLGFAVLITHLPQLSDRYRLSDTSVTLILLLVVVLAGVGSVGSEAPARRRSSRLALRLALFGVAASLIWVTLAPTLAVALPGLAGYGLAAGGVDATANMQGVAVQHRYGRSIITSFHAWWSAAAITGALVVAGAEKLDLSLAASVLPVAAVVLMVAGIGGRRLLAGDDADDADRAGGDDREPAGGTAPRRTLLALGVALTCFWAVDAGISNWSALYLDDALHAGSAAALGYAAYQATSLASRLAGDRVADRIGAVPTVRVGALAAAAGTLLVIVAPSPPVAIAGFLLTGVGLPVVAPLCFSAVSAAARAAGGGRAAVEAGIARLNVFNYAGSLIGAAVIGGVGSLATLRAGFAVSVGLAAAVAVVAPVFATADQV